MRSLVILLVLAGPAVAEPVKPRDGLEEAVRSIQAHDLESAETLLLAAREERPEDARVAFHLGRVLLARGRSREAVDELERAVRLDPASSDSHFWLAEALVERIGEVPFFLKLGIANRMRAAYEKAVELDPENLEARVAVARYHSEAPAVAGGSAERAAAELAEIERRDPALAHLARGLIHEQLGRLEPAEEELQRAVAVDPESVLSWREAGLFYQRRARWEDARRAFEEVLARAPDDPVALYEAARTAIAISERHLARAEKALLAYLRLEPGPEPVLLSEAPPPRPAGAFRQLGRVYERQGRPEIAVREYEAAARLDPGNREIQEDLARARGQAGCVETDAGSAE